MSFRSFAPKESGGKQIYVAPNSDVYIRDRLIFWSFLQILDLLKNQETRFFSGNSISDFLKTRFLRPFSVIQGQKAAKTPWFLACSVIFGQKKV